MCAYTFIDTYIVVYINTYMYTYILDWSVEEIHLGTFTETKMMTDFT